jgi:hypothetical protein
MATLAGRVLRGIDHFAERLERRLGLPGASLVGGAILLALAAIYTTPAYQVINNGTSYAAMATDPFDFHDGNVFRHRILSSLLAHFLYLRGPSFLWFPILVSIVFLGSIYFCFRKWQFSRCESWLIASLMAFSSPILFLLHFQGYTDVLSHLLLFLCYVFRGKRLIWSSSLALALLNHEASAFSVPWILFFAAQSTLRKAGSDRRRAALGLCMDLVALAWAFVPVALLKLLVPLPTAPESAASYEGLIRLIQWNVGIIARMAWFGVFEAFKLFWFLPLLAIARAPRGAGKARIAGLILTFSAGFLQLLVAHDISRHMGHSFLTILLGAMYLKEVTPDHERFARRLLCLVAANFLVPQYYVGQRLAWPFLPLPVSLILLAFGLDPWRLPWIPWN